MDISSLVQRIKTNRWWSEETPCVHQVAEWAWRGFIENGKYFDPRFLSCAFYIYKNDFAFEETPTDEKLQQWYFVLDQLKANPNYLLEKRKEYDEIGQPLITRAWQLLSNTKTLSREALAEEYGRMYKRDLIQWGAYATFIECIDPYTEEVLPALVKKELPNVSDSAIREIILTLCAPSFLSFMEHERIAVLKAALLARDRNNDMSGHVTKLVQSYIWMATHYGAATPKDEAAFDKEISTLLETHTNEQLEQEIAQLENKIEKLNNEKREMYKHYELSDEIKHIFNTINFIGEWIDARKSYAMQFTFITYHLLDIFESVLHVPARLLGYTTADELSAWLAFDANAIPVEILQERQKLSVFFVEKTETGDSKCEFITGTNAQTIFDTFFAKQQVNEFSGTVASMHTEPIEGRVSVVLNSTTDPFVDGDILVTTMTRPDFLPLMRRAKAIITDEGGLTCHAAIISREMKKPCIIGTKIATKALKTGDRVIMDANTGIVRKI